MDVKAVYLNSNHIDDVMYIERQNFTASNCWRREDYKAVIRGLKNNGMVFRFSGCEALCGYVIYALEDWGVWIGNMAVHPMAQRMGVGTAILTVMQEKTAEGGRTTVELCVNESNLPMQLLLRSCGFECDRIEPGEFNNRDGYHFQWRRTSRCFVDILEQPE